MGLKFNPKQSEGWKLLASPKKTRILFDGGSRSGKTALIAEYLVRRALQYPGSRQLAARKHRAHAKTSLWSDTLKSYLVRNLPSGVCRFQESELTIVFYNGSSIMVGGLDDEERTEKHRQHVLHECGSSGTNLLHRSHFSVYRTLPN